MPPAPPGCKLGIAPGMSLHGPSCESLWRDRNMTIDGEAAVWGGDGEQGCRVSVKPGS